MSLELLVETARPWPLIWSLVAGAVLLALVGVLLLARARRR